MGIAPLFRLLRARSLNLTWHTLTVQPGPGFPKDFDR